MSASMQAASQLVALERLRPSSTESQRERRAHFDQAAIAELAESIKTVGLLSPIIVRPQMRIDVTQTDSGRWYAAYKKASADGHNLTGGGHLNREDAEQEAAELRARQALEIVAGERRFLAVKAAGLTEIPVCLRELTNEQVLEVQLVENLQREGLHELAEAEGYEGLQSLGHTIEEIADKVGKSKAYVYARMKLLALAKPGRAAFYRGDISASIALLLARIPVESLQLEALKVITDGHYGSGPLSFREATNLVHEDYMTALGAAGFPTADASLVPEAGACGACQKRTGNQRELFADVKSADVCTDPVCFKAKREAYAARAIAEAGAKGQKVIAGAEAKKIAPYGAHNLRDGFQLLEAQCYEDPKRRTYKQLLGKGFEPTLLHDPDTGAVVKIVDPASIHAALKKAGVKTRNEPPANQQAAAEKKVKAERRWRAAVYSAMREQLPEHLGPEDLRTIALCFYRELQRDTQKQILALWRLEPEKGADYEAPITKLLDDPDDACLARFFFDMVFMPELQVFTWSSKEPTLLLRAARKLNVDPAQIRKDLRVADKKTPARAAKSKPKRG